MTNKNDCKLDKFQKTFSEDIFRTISARSDFEIYALMRLFLSLFYIHYSRGMFKKLKGDPRLTVYGEGKANIGVRFWEENGGMEGGRKGHRLKYYKIRFQNGNA